MSFRLYLSYGSMLWIIVEPLYTRGCPEKLDWMWFGRPRLTCFHFSQQLNELLTACSYVFSISPHKLGLRPPGVWWKASRTCTRFDSHRWDGWGDLFLYSYCRYSSFICFLHWACGCKAYVWNVEPKCPLDILAQDWIRSSILWKRTGQSPWSNHSHLVFQSHGVFA